MPETTSDNFVVIHELIKSGRATEARKLLLQQFNEGVAANKRAQFSSFCRRVGSPAWSLKVLAPIVFPKNKKNTHVSDEELFEYAAALIQVGSVNTALKVISRIEKKSPRTHLQIAFAHMKRWDYQGALKNIHNYLNSKEIWGYEKKIGEVNLLATLIVLEDYTTAEKLLPQLQKETMEAGFKLLHLNIQELALQLYIETWQWDKAEEHLEKIKDLLKSDNNSNDHNFLKKWELIYYLKRFPERASKLSKNTEELKNSAFELHDWETMRDLDFYFSLAKSDFTKLRKIYAGTPHLSYRKKIKRALDQNPKSKAEKTWSGFMADGKSTDVLNLEELTWNSKALDLKDDGLIMRALKELLKDFYSHPTLAELHESLFPDRHYHPDASPVVIYQLINRLKRFCEESKIPLDFEIKNFFVYLKFSTNIQLVLPLEETKQRIAKNVLEFVKKNGDLDFKTTDVAEFLQISSRQADRLIKEEIEKGNLVLLGQGRRSRYKLAA